MTTNELRTKFEAVAKGYGYCVDRYPMDGYWTGAYIREGVRELWAFWQAAHASRDAEVEALRSGLAEAREGWHQANGVADLAIQHRDAAEAEVEALRKDAERYQLLRSCSGYQAPFCVTQNIGHDWIIVRRDELDQAIDDAMAKESGE